MEIRKPLFAGSFYPENREELKNQIINFLNHAKKIDIKPKALIVPHAGYIYSGQTAAYGYKLLDNQKKILLLGPSHNVSNGFLSDTSDCWETPLGKTKLYHPDVRSELSTKAHKMEHSLEVQLPFLQTVLKDFEICPLLIANTDLNFVSKEVESISNDIIIVSSDLSHYHPLIKGELRGCIGTIEARDTIENSVIVNAVNAAFYDPRFEKLSREELKQIKIEISILSEPTNLIYITPEDLLKKLNGQGIILAYNKNKALFLPQVWEDLPKKEDFLSHLCLKAGISKDSWKTKKLTIKQFTVDSFEEE